MLLYWLWFKWSIKRICFVIFTHPAALLNVIIFLWPNPFALSNPTKSLMYLNVLFQFIHQEQHFHLFSCLRCNHHLILFFLSTLLRALDMGTLHYYLSASTNDKTTYHFNKKSILFVGANQSTSMIRFTYYDTPIINYISYLLVFIVHLPPFLSIISRYIWTLQHCL